VPSNDLIIGGLHAVRTAFERAPADCLELSVKQGSKHPEIGALDLLAQRHGVSVQQVETATLNKLYDDSHHQGVVLRRRVPAAVPLKNILGEYTPGSPPLFLVLDMIQDPRNFGACLRVADGAGVTAVIYPRDKSARLGNVVAKAASGAIDTVARAAVPNLAAALRSLRDAGVWITGAAHDTSLSLYAVDFRVAAAIVLGNEGQGLRRLTREHCDQLAGIPMHGRLDSLNVATATAVCLFEARRQRLAGVAQVNLNRPKLK
jgi:23S rRNA (guanosine2251-2'-O)-methyltransferase